MRICTVVIAYNRYEHTCKVLNGLQQNGAKNITLYLDAPKNERDEKAQNKIMLATNRFDFKINLIRRQKNLGLAKSISQAVSETLKAYDAIILLEDDCVPRKGFLSYMEKLLHFYSGHPSVGALCGYTYPGIVDVKDKSAPNVFFINRFCPWGWATWSEKWDGFSLDLKWLVDETKQKNLDISELGSDIYSYCSNEHFLNNEMDIWSLSWILQLFKNNQKVAYPNYSLIDNIGFDGSGVHSAITNKFSVIDNVYDYSWDEFSCAKLPSVEVLNQPVYQSKVIEFLEENSKMSYLLKNQLDDRTIEKDVLIRVVNHYFDHDLEIIDFHTHLFPASFEYQYLDGIQNILNYHYLHAEFFNLNLISPNKFFELKKYERAKIIWEELFVNRVPMSEATKGVLTILNTLGVPFTKNYEKLLDIFNSVKMGSADYVGTIFNHARVHKVVMTNDIFDVNEVGYYDKLYDDRFYTSIRLDSVFVNETSSIDLDGYCYDLNEDLQAYIRAVVVKIKPVYFAISVDDSFGINDERYIWMERNIFGICEEFAIPVSLMIGVKRGINPDYSLAGDGVVSCDLTLLAEILSVKKNVHFCVTALSREDQYELTVLARKFSNLTIFGTWWFLNNDIFINEITKMRLSLLGTNFIPQHSDSRVLEQLTYKWKHTHNELKELLIEHCSFLIDNQVALTRSDVEAIIDDFYNGNIRQILRDNKCITC